MLDTKGDVKASKRAIKKEDKDETEVKMILHEHCILCWKSIGQIE